MPNIFSKKSNIPLLIQRYYQGILMNFLPTAEKKGSSMRHLWDVINNIKYNDTFYKQRIQTPNVP